MGYAKRKTSASVTASAAQAAPPPSGGAKAAWACDGTPSDCAALGLFLAREAGIDLVVSGINRGMNMGGACVYSGTVAAALEAAMDGAQALAVSLYIDPWGKGEEDFDSAAKAALRVAEWMPTHPLPEQRSSTRAGGPSAWYFFAISYRY